MRLRILWSNILLAPYACTTQFRTDTPILVVVSIAGCSLHIVEATEPPDFASVGTYLTPLVTTVRETSKGYTLRVA